MTHDIARLRQEYAKRAQRLVGNNLYSLFNKSHLFMIQQRQRSVLNLLLCEGLYPLEDKRILEIGCGDGGVLLEYLSYGANPSTLFGVDLLPHRLVKARHRLPQLPIACADGQKLPYASKSFDLVMQYTAFSSILDKSVRTRIAQEMMRIIRPNGLIIWYDFWLNPTNSQVKGILPPEIRYLFPNSHCTFYRVTLAPPIIRRLVGISWMLCEAFEKLRIFNTHYLVAIHPITNN
jgi:ubiquinone/menaquinone biosynthesis C-methylase UbiE